MKLHDFSINYLKFQGSSLLPYMICNLADREGLHIDWFITIPIL